MFSSDRLLVMTGAGGDWLRTGERWRREVTPLETTHHSASI